MTVPFPNVRGPLSKILPGLIQGLSSFGCSIGTEPWERHSDNESFGEKVFGRLQDIIRIRRRLERETFDVMLLQTSHDWNTLIRDILLMLFAGSRCPVTIAQLHGSRSDLLVGPGHPFFKWATKLFLRLSNAILVLSQEELEEWRTFYPKVKVYRVSNPFVPRQNILRNSDAASPEAQSDGPVLLFVGRLMVEKGIYDLLDALAIVKRTTNCHLLVIGDGPEKDRLKKSIWQLGLESDVTLAGYLTGDDLAEAYFRSQVLVLPTFWAEGFPTVVTEAMDAGLPIVTTKIRGMVDHLTEGRNALFVPVKDPVALAETLLKLIADGDLRAKMSRINQTEVQKFRPELVAQEYLRVIQNTARGEVPDA
jgi:glycosyltransferase involved in cell wall biosynthesis